MPKTQPPTSPEDIQAAFLSALSPQDTFGVLFDLVPEIYFFAKDVQGRFTRMNVALLRRLGFEKESEVLGHRDSDFFPPAVAERYRTEDQLVMSKNKPVVDQICFVPNKQGVLTWYLHSKIPLHDSEGSVVGVAGVMRDALCAGAIMTPYEGLRAAADHISRFFAENLSVETLADLVHLSVSQFERRFKAVFRMSPIQYILQLRVENACRDLERSSDTLAEIATRNGFYDQSSFTRQFLKRIGKTPGEYRKHYVKEYRPPS